jgi:hypothetical protein
MLRHFVDLATRAIRLDLANPRIRENDFNKVTTTTNGDMLVHNARFKSRIRGGLQGRHNVRYIRTLIRGLILLTDSP